MANELRTRFVEFYGGQPRVFRAPGRVNLIGEHTDYNDGFVMPAALDFATWVAATPRTDGQVLVRSLSFPDDEATFSIADLKPPGEQKHWADYVKAVAWSLTDAGHGLTGGNLLIHGNVPIGSGLSSSASIEVASAMALVAMAGLPAIPGPQMALLCQRAENVYIGVRCGIMDQFISANGKADHALVLDCRSLDYKLAPLADVARLVICNSGVKHSLADGEYNQRRAHCEAGAAEIGVKALRDATLDQVENLPDELLRKRCRHVVTENERVQNAVTALNGGDLAEFGRLMYASHESLRRDYEVSCEELDVLVELARQIPGVYGARMTGGGFGGCTVNLVEAGSADAFVARIGPEYKARTGIDPQIYQCRAAEGAGEV